jgi:hypothetical protein
VTAAQSIAAWVSGDIKTNISNENIILNIIIFPLFLQAAIMSFKKDKV